MNKEAYMIIIFYRTNPTVFFNTMIMLIKIKACRILNDQQIPAFC